MARNICHPTCAKGGAHTERERHPLVLFRCATVRHTRYLGAVRAGARSWRIIAGASVAAGLVCCGQGKKGPQGRPPPQVSIARVEVRDVPVELRAPIDLRPLTQADVGSKTLGYLDAVLVDRG